MFEPPPAGLKMVLRRLVDADGSACLGGAGGGGTEKRARSCSSVSRIRLVISWFWRRAFVKIFGGANLACCQTRVGREEAVNARQLCN